MRAAKKKRPGQSVTRTGNLDPTVNLTRLTHKEIKRIKSELAKKANSSRKSEEKKKKKKRITTTVVTFDPDESSSNEDEDPVLSSRCNKSSPKKRMRLTRRVKNQPTKPATNANNECTDPRLNGRKLWVHLINLRPEEIEKIKAEVAETGEAPAKPEEKKKIVTRIVSFDPDESSNNEDEDGEDEDDYETSSCSSEERNSTISYVTKIPHTKISQWRRKVIIALVSRMRFEESRKAKNGLEPSKYTFELRKRDRTLLFGKIAIAFHEKERNLGCSKCPEYRTTHHESNYFSEVTSHMLKHHLGNGSGGDSSSTITTGGSKKKRKAENWDPEWEESDHSGQEEEAEVVDDADTDTVVIVRSKKDEDCDAVIVPERCTRPKREAKITARFTKSRDETINLDDEEQERSGAEEWAPNASDLDDSDGDKKVTTAKKKVKRSASPSKKTSPAKSSKGQSHHQKISPNKKILVGLINKWDMGKEGKTAFQLIKKKGLPESASFAKSICSFNDLTGEMKVLNTKIIFNEQNTELALECSRCTHVVKDLDFEDVSVSSLPQNFTAHRDIILHVLGKHLNAFDCCFCGKRFTTPYAVSSHMRNCEQQYKNEDAEKNSKNELEELAQADSQKENDIKKRVKDTIDDGSARKKISLFATPTLASDQSKRTGKISLGSYNYFGRKKSEKEESSSDDESLPDID